MSIKRIVDTGFWTDDKVVDEFSPEDKLFMLYLLTNPHTTQLGIYKLNKRQGAFELGYSTETISVLIDRFENKYGIIKYSRKTSEIAVKNYLVYSIVKGGRPVEDLLNKEINEVKDSSLIDFVFENISNKNINETVNKIIKEYYNDNYNDNDNDVSYHDSCNDSLPLKKIKRFVKPTLEEVEAYCKERNNGIDAQHFIDFYESKDWFIGKNKMKDWRACIRTWERHNANANASKNRPTASPDSDEAQREFHEDLKRYGLI